MIDLSDPRQRAVFFDVHTDLPREGPGNRASTLRALALAGDVGRVRDVLDIGCGPGKQTLDLMRAVPNASFVAVDLHAPYLEKLRQGVADAGLSDRLRVQQGNMSALPFASASFDLLWCEGAAYIMGTDQAMRAWKRFLRPQGALALTEPVWLRDDPPDFVVRNWEEYPAMRTIEHWRAVAAEAGYRLLGDFVLPEEAWMDDYYEPMRKRVAALRARYAGDDVARHVLDECDAEIHAYEKGSAYFGYAFMIVGI